MAQAEAGTPDGLSAQDVRNLYDELRGLNSVRNAEYLAAQRVYRGDHWDGVNLIPEDGRYSITVNYLQPMVDGAVEQLIGVLPGLQVMPPGTDEVSRRLAEQMEAVLYKSWEYNESEKVFRRVAFNAILKRRGFVYTWWDTKSGCAHFRSIAPENVYPVYDGDEMCEVVIVTRRLTRALKHAHPNLADKITSDGFFDEGSDPDPSRTPIPDTLAGTTKVIDWFDKYGNWVRIMGEAEHVQRLPYNLGSVPVVEFVNNLPGDESEPIGLGAVLAEINRYLSQVFSQQADIIKKYSNPPILDFQSGQSPQSIRNAVRADGAVIPVRKDSEGLRYLNWDGSMPEIASQIERTENYIHDLGGRPRSAFGETLTNQSGVMTNLSMTPTIQSSQARETLFGQGMVRLNQMILALHEHMSPNSIEIKTTGKSRNARQPKLYEVMITGKDIAGWRKNQVKWPSALRIDDPVHVQNLLQRMQSQPPALSVYTALEEFGIEDVEAELDRIGKQLEDPRFHPDRLTAAVGAAAQLGEAQIPTDLEGIMGGAGGGLDAEDVNDGMEAAGSPDRDTLVQSEY